MNFKDKEFVWINPHPEFEWYPGKIVDRVPEKKIIKVEDRYGEVFDVKEDKAEFVHGDSLTGINDLINLGDFNEGAQLHNVRMRYENDEIYTSIGQAILIAINPYKRLPIYTEAYRDVYLNKSIEKFEKTEPHLYKMGEISFSSMIATKSNQSMIISGESGAGKTESMKYVLTYQTKAHQIKDASGEVDDIESRILYTNPVLEAFGNAKTIRNDNSSRFGKFVELFFDENHQIHSAKITNYMLEKSRIVMQQDNERNYHIFYMLTKSAAPELKNRLHLPENSKWAYLNENYDRYDDFLEKDNVDYSEMLMCMNGLKVNQIEQNELMDITAAIQHLGQVKFVEQKEGSNIKKTDDHYKHVATLFGISENDLSSLMCSKTMITPGTGEKIIIDVDCDTARINRDTLSKIIYEGMFNWQVKRVNVSIKKDFEKSASSYKSVGQLDIFGFEIFKDNSFEQLCINYTNEKLQQHFNQHMFKIEQKEYEAERIQWSHIQFVDNAECIVMIEGKTSVFSLLDEQCRFQNSPAESDKKFLDKLKNTLGKNKYYIQGDVKFRMKGFGIGHYAGCVQYNVKDFCEKNRNSVNKEINTVFAKSKNSLLCRIFKQKLEEETGKSLESVSKSFSMQLASLVEHLNNSTPLYIRCIKPNGLIKPDIFESYEVCRQLRCAGMLEAIRIRKCGFPVRRPYDTFTKMYKNLFDQYKIKAKNAKDRCREFLDYLYNESIVDKKLKEIQLGTSKIFMKEHMKSLLDKLLEESIVQFAIRIQKHIKRFVQRRRYLRQLHYARYLQNRVRMILTLYGIKKRAKERVKRERYPALMITRAATKYLFRKKIWENLHDLVIQKRQEVEREKLMEENNAYETTEDQGTEIAKIKGILSNLFDKDHNKDGKSDDKSSEEDNQSGYWLEELENLRNENQELKDKLEQKEQVIKDKDTVNQQLTNNVNRYKSELHKKNENVKHLERVNKEYQTKEKLYKEERQKLRDLLIEKDTKLKKAQTGGIDSNFQSKLENEVGKMRSKDEEIATLKKKKNSQEYKVAQMTAKVAEMGSKDKNIAKLAQELDYYKSVSLPNSSNPSVLKNSEGGEVEYFKKKFEESQKTNNLCADLVRDLVGMIQWKYIEVEFVKKSFENKITDDEKAKFETQKSKEKRIFERMLNNYKQLEDIKKRERDEEENMLGNSMDSDEKVPTQDTGDNMKKHPSKVRSNKGHK